MGLNVADLQVEALAQAQAAGVEGDQGDAVVEGRDGGEDAPDFGGRQNDGELELGLARTNPTSAGHGWRMGFSQKSLTARLAWVELEREKRRSVLRWRKYWRSSSALRHSGARPKCSPNWRTQAR